MHATIFDVVGLANVKWSLNPSWGKEGAIFEEIKWGNQYFL